MSPGCNSTIQMVGQTGACLNFEVGQPQNGQTPNGRLSNVAQTVNWQVDPTTYGGSTTFDVTVSWQAQIADSISFLWYQPILWPSRAFRSQRLL